MKLHNISLNNLMRRKARMVFLTIGLTVGIATVVSLITLTRSMSGDIERKMDEFGANILITPRSNGLSMSYGGISLGGVTFDQAEIHEDELKAIHTIENHRNLAAVAPKVLGGVAIDGHDLLLVGVDFDNELKMKQWWQIFGKLPEKQNELLLGSDAAATLLAEPGDELSMRGETWLVSGVLEQTGSQDDAMVFAELHKTQKLLGKEGKITMVEVAALCHGCPIGDMVTQIAEKMPGAKVTAIQQVVAGRLQALDQFKRFSYSIATVVLFIGALIVFVTMMASVNERTVEIGVFRAIGFRKTDIMRVILLEAALVSLLAGLLGYGLGMVTAALSLPYMAESKNAILVFSWWVGGGALILALFTGLTASLYPALKASRMDPTEALRAL